MFYSYADPMVKFPTFREIVFSLRQNISSCCNSGLKWQPVFTLTFLKLDWVNIWFNWIKQIYIFQTEGGNWRWEGNLKTFSLDQVWRYRSRSRDGKKRGLNRSWWTGGVAGRESDSVSRFGILSIEKWQASSAFVREQESGDRGKHSSLRGKHYDLEVT